MQKFEDKQATKQKIMFLERFISRFFSLFIERKINKMLKNELKNEISQNLVLKVYKFYLFFDRKIA